MSARHCIGHPPRGTTRRRVASPVPLAILLASWTGAALLAAGAAGADELYRWVEPDGSITFSPRRPPPGIDFETVDAGAATPAPAAPLASAPLAPATPAPDAPAAAPRANVAYAPPPLGAAVSTSASESANDAPDASQDTTPPAGRTGVPNAIDPADARHRAQCRELEKRVVSLERSLMIEMPPERMDDTVMAMARYQVSLDNHCRR